MQNKIVDIFAYGHNPADKYMPIQPEDWDLFIIEGLEYKTLDEAFQQFKSLKKEERKGFDVSQNSYLQILSKKNIPVVVGDYFAGNTSPASTFSKVNEKFMIASKSFNIKDIKDFYLIFAEEFRIRNKNYIANIIHSDKEYIGIRFGAAHSLIAKELQQYKCDILLSISPLIYNYGESLHREIYLGNTIHDADYIKGWISSILSMEIWNNTDFCKNITGKQRLDINQQDLNIIAAFFNALIDSNEEQLSSIRSSNIMDLFSLQGFNNPTLQRIPRQQIRDFLKNFSIKKYGTTVYYDRLERQGMIY